MVVESLEWTTPTGEHSRTTASGMEFSMTDTITFTKCIKRTACTATRCLLENSSGGVLATASFVGNDATFDYELSNGVTYRVMTDSSGSSYQRIIQYMGPGYHPLSGTVLTWIRGWDDTGGNSPDFLFNMTSLTFSAGGGDAEVEPDASALTLAIQTPTIIAETPLVVENTTVTSVLGQNRTTASGLRFTMKAGGGSLVKVTKLAASGITRALLRNDSAGVLATASFVGDEATFDYALSNSTTYQIMGDNSGGSYFRSYSTVSYPVVGTTLNYISGLDDTSGIESGHGFNFVSMTILIVDDVVVTPDASALTLSIQTPTITAQSNIIVSPSALALTSAIETPSIIISGAVIVFPEVLGLTSTIETPTIKLPKVVTPDSLDLTLTVQTPRIKLSQDGILFGQTKYGAISKTALFQVYEIDRYIIENN